MCQGALASGNLPTVSNQKSFVRMRKEDYKTKGGLMRKKNTNKVSLRMNTDDRGRQKND